LAAVGCYAYDRAASSDASVMDSARDARIDLQQELSLLDALAFLNRQIGHAAAGVGADVDEPLRLDLARRRDDRLQISLLDCLSVDRDAFGPLEPDVGVRDPSERDSDADADQNLLVPRQFDLPKALMTAASTTMITA
jgi:hypothetical protein